MDNNEILLCLVKLDVNNVAVLKDYGYDDPSDVLTIDVDEITVHLEHSQGYMSFECDSIDFDAKHQKLSFFHEDKPYLEMNIANIYDMRFA